MNKTLAVSGLMLLMIAAIIWPGAAMSQSIIYQNYDQSSVPKNKEGVTLPVYFESGTEGGPFTVSLDTADAISGKSLVITKQNAGDQLYAQFNPNDGTGREFAHTYAACGWPSACGSAGSWQYNTYTKMRFWMKVPTNAPNPDYTNASNGNVGLYVKRVTNADYSSDETGGNHYYHGFYIEPTGTWWQFILPMHPDHERGVNHVTPPYLPYPTSGDPPNTYNYWDAMSRWYIQVLGAAGGPYKVDQIEFYRDPVPEDDVHLTSALTATFVPSSNKVIVNWERQIQDDGPLWDVRYAFSDIHTLGWNNATVAPGSPVAPGWCCDYVGVHYATTAIPTAGRSTLYIAVRSRLEPTKFNQIAIPLSGGATPPPSTPIVSISASPSSITSGQSTTLSWSSSTVTSCTASGGWSGSRATSGNLSVSPTATTTYTLACTGTSGSASQSTTVTVTSSPPAGSAILASPASISFTTIVGVVPATQSITVTVPNGANWSTTDSSPFYDASLCWSGAGKSCASGTQTPIDPAKLASFYNTAGVGTYSSPLTISSPGYPNLVVPVTLTITSTPQPPAAPSGLVLQ